MQKVIQKGVIYGFLFWAWFNLVAQITVIVRYP